MNLRVDLILETEKRNPSIINPKLIIRVSSIVVPAIIGLTIACLVMNNLALGSKLSQLQADWQILEPKKKQAIQMSQQSGANIQMLKAFDGWLQSRLLMQQQLGGLLDVVPSEIQLLSFRFAQQMAVGDGGVTVRKGGFTVEGKAVGEAAESNIKLLEKRYKSDKPFSEKVQNVTMKGSADGSSTSRYDRVFTIVCTYGPLNFLP